MKTLRERRMSLSLTQLELALIAGVDETTVWRWENGVRRTPAWIHVVLDTLEHDQASMVTELGWLLKMRKMSSGGSSE